MSSIVLGQLYLVRTAGYCFVSVHENSSHCFLMQLWGQASSCLAWEIYCFLYRRVMESSLRPPMDWGCTIWKVQLIWLASLWHSFEEMCSQGLQGACYWGEWYAVYCWVPVNLMAVWQHYICCWTGKVNWLCTDDTQVTCVWRRILVDRACTHTWALGHKASMRCGSLIVHLHKYKMKHMQSYFCLSFIPFPIILFCLVLFLIYTSFLHLKNT